MSAALVLLAGCTKSEGSEEGKWYGYEGRGKESVSLYLELKGGQADLIITAWGTRYKGPYTYNAEDGRLVLTYDSCLTRYVGMEEPDKAVLVSNLFNDWPGASGADHVILGKPIQMTFTINGDKATCDIDTLNKPVEMTRE